jgi:predicted transcriptional regulator of viral defense system
MAILTGKSPSTVVQALRRLERQQVVSRMYRGVWSRNESTPLDPFELVPFLLPSDRVYVSFISALHLHGIVGQIPQVVTLASTAHTRTIRTAVGTYRVHRIEPGFFLGFTWYRGTGTFLIAEPEKALLDCLYLAGRKTNRYAHFPELEFPNSSSPGHESLHAV